VARISIVSPCFNEAENVEICYNTIRDLFTDSGPLARHDFELIFSDNASTDGTLDILRRIAAGDMRVKVIVNSRNFGPSRSNFNALRYATGDAVVVFLPVDLQDPPDLIPEMVRHWENGIEIVAGARKQRAESLVLRTCRGLFYRIANGLSDFELPLDVGEFQLIDRKVWEVVSSHKDHYPYIRGIIASTGFKRLILPYAWNSRKRGVSKNNFFSLVDQGLNGIFSFTSVPMRIGTFVGLGVAALSLIYAFGSFIGALLSSKPVPAGTHTIIVAIFFFAGVQLFFIGMLGEYIAAIHAQVRRGPMVIEREKINIPDQAPPRS
jgi:glycosyltransferase involved in cell wall biosynthesis